MDHSADLTIFDLLRRQSTRTTPALLAHGVAPMTWASLFEFVCNLGQELDRFGLQGGMRVALIMPNGPEAALALLAFSSFVTTAPLNPGCRKPELEFAFKDLGINAVAVRAGCCDPAVSVARRMGLQLIEIEPLERGTAGPFRLRGPASQEASNRLSPSIAQDIAFLLQTSGTTGSPKIVPLLHGRVCLTAQNIATVLKLTVSDIGLNVMPLFHVHGIVNVLLSSVAVGAPVVFASDFDPDAFFKILNDYSVTWYSAVPTIHQFIAAKAELDCTHNSTRSYSLRLVRSSSAPLPVHVARRLEALFGAPVIEAYGMTEVDQIASNPLPPRIRKLGSVGCSGGPEIQILADDGRPVAPGQIGQIAVRGPNVMPGYLNNPEANEAAFLNELFLTGDLGRQDEDGYLFLVGRNSEIINRGGEKIAPREIDDCLLDYIDLAAAASFSVPDPILGEDIAVAIVPRTGCRIDLEAIVQHLRTRLAPFKLPSAFYIVDRLPTGPTGKILRRALTNQRNQLRRLYRTSASLFVNCETTRLPDVPFIAMAVRTIVLESCPSAPTLAVDENVFSAGLTSLEVALVISEVERQLTITLSPIALFQNPTLEKFARHLLHDYPAPCCAWISRLKASPIAELNSPSDINQPSG